MTQEQVSKQWFTKEQVRQELQRHGFILSDFVAWAGDKVSYKGSVVLNWLGY